MEIANLIITGGATVAALLLGYLLWREATSKAEAKTQILLLTTELAQCRNNEASLRLVIAKIPEGSR